MSTVSNNLTKAIILAAGRGSRMKRLTLDQPKCLIEIKGKTLLTRQLETLKKVGIKEVAIVTGYQSGRLKEYGNLQFHNSRWAQTNMVFSLKCADSWLRAGPCIVSYSDIFYDPSAVDSLLACNAGLAITYDKNWYKLWSRRFSDPLTDAETFSIDIKNKVIDIGRKPKSFKEVNGQFMGLLRFTPETWADFTRCWYELKKKDQENIDMTTMLQKVIEAKRTSVIAVPYQGEWGELDFISDLKNSFIV